MLTVLRKIIKIDEDKCNGCGLCAIACHEGAIAMVNNKAKLIRDDYCDGLGDCLPVCPTGAISFEQRIAAPFDESAVQAKMKREAKARVDIPKVSACSGCDTSVSELSQWPVQLKLVPVNAPFFDNADLLIAADCTAYAYSNFHQDFIKNRITVIACPKLDATNHKQKLTEILSKNNVRSVTIAKMQVPCCSGLEYATKEALRLSGKMIPTQSITISTDGVIID